MRGGDGIIPILPLFPLPFAQPIFKWVACALLCFVVLCCTCDGVGRWDQMQFNSELKWG
ncbi:hypothetical protein BC832DRAFT_556541 [Gaertneriomyces semiglobifer]|nr:hypothetical protein BC832DRAFT_556541 [Gaertneriomyces semiglobifer]